MSPFVVIFAAAWVLFLLWVGYGAISVRGIEEPAYRVVQTGDGYEIRAYEQFLIAQVAEGGAWDEALTRGFSTLAGYIFGDNIASVSGDTPEGHRIAMTAPVRSQDQNGQRMISFVMPASYSPETLPRPNDPTIRIITVPARTVAVRRFSGWVNEKRAAEEEEAGLCCRRRR